MTALQWLLLSACVMVPGPSFILGFDYKIPKPPDFSIKDTHPETVSQKDILDRLTELEERVTGLGSIGTSKSTSSQEESGSSGVSNAQRTQIEAVAQQVESLAKRTEDLPGIASKVSSLEREVVEIKSDVSNVNNELMEIKELMVDDRTCEEKGDCCQENWIRHGSSCYKFFAMKEAWIEAQKMCKDQASVLTVIETAEENAFLRGHLRTFDDEGADLTSWIGGTDMEVEGTWKWSPNGEALVFTDWGERDPNQDGDCLLMYSGFDYKWADYICESRQHFLCEKPIANDAGTG